jgi:hypothetical protein
VGLFDRLVADAFRAAAFRFVVRTAFVAACRLGGVVALRAADFRFLVRAAFAPALIV